MTLEPLKIISNSKGLLDLMKKLKADKEEKVNALAHLESIPKRE